MFRHTFATEMLRAGVSFPALMKLLGHSSPEMTLLYAEFTQTDLQREFRAARSQPRHLLPPPTTAIPTAVQADLPSTLHALQAAQHVLEMFRRTLPETDDLPCVCSTDWPTASPKSPPNFENSPPHRTGQRLAG